ncbi:C-factor [Porphyridium purpureum]|uniref:C-factor n=1 Tax=Porphyridium purpureum TaxID=35688 RepID=A0A5J4YY46_PORPP|nr:C-factor [Porphyridium purpureum]|eukprot:POR0219..scf209_3
MAFVSVVGVATRAAIFGGARNKAWSAQRVKNVCRSSSAATVRMEMKVPKVPFPQQRYDSLLPKEKWAATFGKTLVVGGDSGQGLEFVRQLVAAGVHVIAAFRKSAPSDQLKEVNPAQCIPGVNFLEDNVDKVLNDGLGDTKVDTMLMVSGYFTEEGALEVVRSEEEKMYKICAISPTQIITSMFQSGKFASNARIGMITSEGGSIGLRTEQEGGKNYAHHGSKAASNMVVRLLGYDLKPHGISIVGMHPGFIKTPMTEKYSHFYEEFGAVEASVAVPFMLQCVAELDLDHTGRFVAAMGAYGLGLGALAIAEPEKLKPGDDLPW